MQRRPLLAGATPFVVASCAGGGREWTGEQFIPPEREAWVPEMISLVDIRADLRVFVDSASGVVPQREKLIYFPYALPPVTGFWKVWFYTTTLKGSVEFVPTTLTITREWRSAEMLAVYFDMTGRALGMTLDLVGNEQSGGWGFDLGQMYRDFLQVATALAVLNMTGVGERAINEGSADIVEAVNALPQDTVDELRSQIVSEDGLQDLRRRKKKNGTLSEGEDALIGRLLGEEEQTQQ